MWDFKAGFLKVGLVEKMLLNKLSQLGTEKVLQWGQHFWKPYGGF